MKKNGLEISEEAKICINRISLYEEFLNKKDVFIQELEKYSQNKQYKILNEIIKEERKYVNYLVARKNIYMKEENYDMVSKTREHIREMYKFIEWCIEHKNNFLKDVEIKKDNKSKKDELVFDVTTLEMEKIDKINNQNNLKLLHDVLEKNLRERYESIIKLRKEYIKLYSNEKEKIEILKESKNLRKQLNKSTFDINNTIKEIKDNVAILNKIILYLNRVISIDIKMIPKEERSKQENDVNSKISKIEEQILKEISLSNDELVYNYKELLFETKNIIFIRKLMEEFPNIYSLKDGKNHFVFDTILEQYTNILLNKNFTLEETEKQKIKKESTLKELEYYESIILDYVIFAKEKKLDFVEGSIIKRVNQIINIVENNELYLKKGKDILSHLSSIVEAVNISGLDEIDNKKTRTITDEFIFSIDSDNTKTKENAMSIKLIENMYHINFYVTDISGFIIHNQKFIKRAQNKLLYSNEDDRIFSGQLKSMFSLNQGRSKKAVGYHLVVDKDFNIKDFKIEKNIVNLNRNFKESEVNNIIENNLIQKGSEEINLLYQLLLSKIDGEIRNKAQYIITFITRIISKKLGEYCYLQNVNCLYNVNGHNHYEVLESNELAFDNAYIKFSAPLRNYASLVNQLAVLGYDLSNKEIENTYLLLNKDDKTKVKK